MKTMKNIFAKIFVTGVMLGCVLVMPVWAAASNGCENPNNDYIVPSLALCSTHVYNIGQTENPTYETRSIMQDVIALKTTVIAQQMYKQYEYLEAMKVLEKERVEAVEQYHLNQDALGIEVDLKEADAYAKEHNLKWGIIYD